MRLGIFVLAILLTGAAVWWLARDLAPPKTLVFAAGSEGGGYWQLAERYRAILARDGIDVELLVTAGSVENAAILAERRADVALLQGGIATEPGLEALGAMFIEPIFVFVRNDTALPPNIGAWRDVRMAAGGEGSGTRAVVDRVTRIARIPSTALVLDPRGGADGADALLAGEVEVAVFVAPITAPYLAELLTSDAVRLLELDHLPALSRMLPQSKVISLPSGALSLSPPVPEAPRQMLAMAATLAAQDDLHPSLVDRLVEAAREIHRQRTATAAAGTFPSIQDLELPINAQARDLIVDGPSDLQAYVPYWVAAQIDRFAILFVPVLILMLPLIRILPGIYAWQMRHRVVRHYAAIRDIDDEARDATVEQLRALRAKLDEIDADIAEINLPLHYRQTAYTARVHIDLLHGRISRRLDEEARSSG